MFPSLSLSLSLSLCPYPFFSFFLSYFGFFLVLELGIFVEASGHWGCPARKQHRADSDYFSESHLKSPVIELVVGEGGDATTLYAHERLLIQSPYFEGAVAELAGQSRRITLPQEDLDAVASFLEFLYKADYFPTLSGAQSLEEDPSTPFPDTTGVALLRHARIYTLARRFGLPSLAALAHRKIHLTQSTARGEIAYARYVYANTSPEDESIRKPVAAFWATRSHVLRHEAEREFRTMCLDFPQFGFDVLSLVLDAQEKRTARSEASQVVGSRKRARVSNA